MGPVAVPPPGGPALFVGQWNYWHNLVVTPNTTLSKGFYHKWSQPPVIADPNHLDPPLFYGWDEISDFAQRPILADDWECKDDRPVTDFHWWGSYPGWNQSFPPCLPQAFHIGIWTDVPDPDPTDPTTHSQPGELKWENYCDNYTWNFAGFDKDPRSTIPEEFNESCFQFNQFLSQDEWFYQEPSDDPNNPTIYWVSIAPIWGACTYQWGWKTRPHFYQDDAVRIQAVALPDGTDVWPPSIGTSVTAANPIYWPGGDPLTRVSWDLSFEITTIEPDYCDDPIPGDLNCDKRVDLLDLGIFVSNWLATAP
jgi:hypothetical protein